MERRQHGAGWRCVRYLIPLSSCPVPPHAPHPCKFPTRRYQPLDRAVGRGGPVRSLAGLVGSSRVGLQPVTELTRRAAANPQVTLCSQLS